MSILYFIRHGQASFGEADYDVLSERGHQQARIVAEYLCSMGIAFHTVFTGTLQRQVETARALTDRCRKMDMPQPEIRRLPAFNEYDSEGVFKGLLPIVIREDAELGRLASQLTTDKRSFQLVFEKLMHCWVSGDYPITDLETWAEFRKRVNGAIDDIMADAGKGRNIAVFTSGGPISVTVQRALNVSDADTIRLNWQVANASITRFRFTTDRIMLSTFNEFGHLESNAAAGMVTYR